MPSYWDKPVQDSRSSHDYGHNRLGPQRRKPYGGGCMVMLCAFALCYVAVVLLGAALEAVLS